MIVNLCDGATKANSGSLRKQQQVKAKQQKEVKTLDP